MSSETAKNFVDSGSVERRADHDLVYCRECDLVGDLVCSQKGPPQTDTSVGTWNFTEYWNSSVISWSHHP